MDARLTVAALKVAIERRRPPPGCIHHSDRGSQYAAELYRSILVADDCFQTSTIGGAYINEDPFAHAADSHANRPGGILDDPAENPSVR
jgi:hypothetical protein